MNLEDKLDKIKKKLTNKSSFIYSTYVWNYDKINPNSKGDDLYTKQNVRKNKILNEVFKDYDKFKKNIHDKGYTFEKTDNDMKKKIRRFRNNIQY